MDEMKRLLAEVQEEMIKCRGQYPRAISIVFLLLCNIIDNCNLYSYYIDKRSTSNRFIIQPVRTRRLLFTVDSC